jgi:hypothetical protein
MGKKKQKVKQILQASYMNQKEASKLLENKGYKYDPELSTNESKVFVDKKGNPNIAFRGSKRASDFLGSDLKLALGLEKYDRRFQEANDLTKMVTNKYGKPPSLFGSSLGGSIAEKTDGANKVYTHNKGTSIFDIGKTIPKTQTDFRNKNDVVSLLSLTQNHNHNNLKEIQTNHKPTDILGNHKLF